MKMKAKLSVKQQSELLNVLKERFEKNMTRHKRLKWAVVEVRLLKQTDKLPSLAAMEETGGEPDVVALDKKSGEYTFIDCSPESPTGRRSTCFDGAARKTRKEHAPEQSAKELAAKMGTEILTEKEYRALQKLGEFDIKTSSWIETPEDIRKLGGALFADRRYNTVFVYHNGADSYYASRGFRASLRI